MIKIEIEQLFQDENGEVLIQKNKIRLIKELFN